MDNGNLDVKDSRLQENKQLVGIILVVDLF
jgi:hypothetical protein